MEPLQLDNGPPVIEGDVQTDGSILCKDKDGFDCQIPKRWELNNMFNYGHDDFRVKY